MKLYILLSVWAILALSEAKEGFGPGEQDWGYVTVRDGAHMFWWLYHTTADVAESSERPLIIWLQGGPGGSSCGYGNFEILGPLDVDLNPRDYTWVKDFNLLLIDNPVGTGFSYVESPSLYAKDNKQVARDLVFMMRSFYESNPQFKNTSVYVFGQSYGGKMAVDFALLMWHEQQAGTMFGNISGVAMGNAWIHPIDATLSWGPFLYQVSLVDADGLEQINRAAEYTKAVFDAGQYYQATEEWANTQYVVLDKTDGVDFYNILTKKQKSSTQRTPREMAFDMMTHSKYNSRADSKLDELMNGPVKAALGIPANVIWGSQSEEVFEAMYIDFMKSVTDVIENLLNVTPLSVFVYNGNMDLICDTPGQKQWVERLRWENENSYRSAPRRTIYVNNTAEGYKRVGGRFGFFWLNVAGHSAPANNPPGMREVLREMTGV